MNRKQSAIRVGRVLAIVVSLVSFASSAFAANESVLYRFRGVSHGDGAAPYAAMVADKQGNLYGTSIAGGASSSCGTEGCGTIFELSPPTGPGAPWTEALLYNFAGGNAGASPWGTLVLDNAGNLYGTTAAGGIANCATFSGCGVVFELSPPSVPGNAWTETVLYSFAGGNDGANPWAGVIMDKNGNLYGTTRWGGSARNAGTAFELSPPAAPGGPWTETILHIFGASNDGANPVAALTFGRNGAPYGVTLGGRGLSQNGTVFKLKPPTAPGGSWTEGIVYRFTGGSDGGNPVASMIGDKAGNFYGTTSSGGQRSNGVVFEISPSGSSWTESVLYSFTGGSDGSSPTGTLVADSSGNLYGTAESGGVGRVGSVFELSPGSPWTETTLYGFAEGRGGEEPYAGLVLDRGHLFGTTPYGGFGVGTLFAVGP